MKSFPRHSLLAFLSLFSSFYPAATEAKILRVSPDGAGTDGLSWETAFQTVEDAVVQAASGDDLWIREGTYNEAITLKPGLSLFGGFSGSESAAEFNQRDPMGRPTIIDGTGLDSSVVVAADLPRLDGITIRGGDADQGGGIRCDMSRLHIVECVITENDATFRGGGIYCSQQSTLHLTNSSVSSNIAGPSFSPEGSGLYVSGSDCKISSSSFRHNRTLPIPPDPFGAPPLFFGGALFVVSSSLEVLSSQIRSNQGGTAGGIFARTVESSPIHRVTIVNSAVTDNTSNRALGAAGGLVLQNTLNTVSHCTIANNLSPGGNAAINASTVVAIHCIMTSAGTGRQVVVGSGTDGDITYSLIRGGFPGEGNVDADPLFVDPEIGDYRLLPGSPCIDAGTAVPIFTDLDGNPRPIDIPGVGRDGEGAYDMGAYEFPGPFRNSKSDIDQNGIVDTHDLMILLRDWMKVSDASQ